MKKGKFIVLEGIDGSGKSSQAEMLFKNLKKQNANVHLTAQPTKRLIGKTLRRYLSGEEKTNDLSLALLFASDRLDHILNEENGVLKLLNEGVNVICDRNYFSNFAYQSDPNDRIFVVEINKKAREILKPDAHIFIDVTPEVSLKRIQKGRENTEIFENISDLTTIYDNFHYYFDMLKDEEKIIKICGDRDFSLISEDILKIVENIINE